MYKKIIEGKKAVIFDLDGTVVDTEPLWRKAFTDILATMHMEWFDHNEVLVGAGIQHKWEFILHRYAEYMPNKQNLPELINNTYQGFIKTLGETQLEPKAGFWELAYELKENKGFTLALASNSPKTIVDLVLKKLGISATFDFVIAGDEVKKVKPHPEIYIKTLNQLKLKPEEVLVFEDSVPGAVAAFQAKLDTIVIWDGVLPKFRYPPTVKIFIPTFEGLPNMLDTTLDEELRQAAQKTPTDVA